MTTKGGMQLGTTVNNGGGLHFYTSKPALDAVLDKYYARICAEILVHVKVTHISNRFKVKSLLSQLSVLQKYSITSQTLLIRTTLRNMVEDGQLERVSQIVFKVVNS